MYAMKYFLPHYKYTNKHCSFLQAAFHLLLYFTVSANAIASAAGKFASALGQKSVSLNYARNCNTIYETPKLYCHCLTVHMAGLGNKWQQCCL